MTEPCISIKRRMTKLPPEIVKKVREYQAAGHLFGLCTGRQVGGLTPFIAGFVEPDFYITSSGANIVDRNYQAHPESGAWTGRWRMSLSGR